MDIFPHLFFYTFCGHSLYQSKILLCLFPEATYRLFCLCRVIFFLFQKIRHFRKPKGIHIVSRFFIFFFNHNHITDRHGMSGKIIRMIKIEFFIQRVQCFSFLYFPTVHLFIIVFVYHQFIFIHKVHSHELIRLSIASFLNLEQFIGSQTFCIIRVFSFFHTICHSDNRIGISALIKYLRISFSYAQCVPGSSCYNDVV